MTNEQSSTSYPSGTGSYNYAGNFAMVVQNLAYSKHVSIWGRRAYSGWQMYPANYVESVPENREIWKLDSTDELVEFDAEYTVNGVTYWDNNHGQNYRRPEVHDEFDALLGDAPEVVMGTASFVDDTHIAVLAGLRNLDYYKTVGIVFTTDNWVTTQTAYGHYHWTMPGGTEVWKIEASVSRGQQVEYAIFYRVRGTEYWDNNFWHNYRLIPPSSAAPSRVILPMPARLEIAWEKAA